MSENDRENAGGYFSGLQARITAFLSLALLPIGLIAIFQTNEIDRNAERNMDNVLLSLSEKAAEHEFVLIRRGIGAATTLGHLVPEITADSAICQRVTDELLAQIPAFDTISIVDSATRVLCTSSDDALAPAIMKKIRAAMDSPGIRIDATPETGDSERQPIHLLVPYRVNATFGGYFSITLRPQPFTDRSPLAAYTAENLVELMTLGNDGTILYTKAPGTDIGALLPMQNEPAWLPPSAARSFEAVARDGNTYFYTAIPSNDLPVTILGVWHSDRNTVSGISRVIPSGLVPAIMWLASLLVAVMAVNTLVISHIRRLRRDMTNFAESRIQPTDDHRASMPSEIAAVHAHFSELTFGILREEARLEELVREKNVLLKEVHHRVKNNLQTIASIMNMQIRAADHAETAESLQKIQNRVTSLAAIHRDLYDADNGGKVNVGELVRDTVNRTLALAGAEGRKIRLQQDIDDVYLLPDQAVPLSLLTNEATTNATSSVKTEGDLWVKFKQDGQSCTLDICNSYDAAAEKADSGLGDKLIRAFAIQLGSEVEKSIDDNSYRIVVRFEIQQFENETRDF